MSADDAHELTVADFELFLNRRGGANVASLIFRLLTWSLTVDDVVSGNFEESPLNCLIDLSGKLHWASELPNLKINQCYIFTQYAESPGKLWLCDCTCLFKKSRPERVDSDLYWKVSAEMVKDLETGECVLAGEGGKEKKSFDMNVRYQNGTDTDEDELYTYKTADSQGALIFHAKDVLGEIYDEISDG
jgi:hypothetical protein